MSQFLWVLSLALLLLAAGGMAFNGWLFWLDTVRGDRLPSSPVPLVSPFIAVLGLWALPVVVSPWWYLGVWIADAGTVPMLLVAWWRQARTGREHRAP